MNVSWKTDCILMVIVSILFLECGIQLVHSDPLSSTPISQSDSNCPSLVNCTKTCFLGMKKSADGCTVCECKVKGLFQGDIMIDENSYNDFLDLFGEENRTRISKRSAVKSSLGREWPKVRGKVVVPYVFDDTVGEKLKKIIKSAMRSYKKSTCVRFRPRNGESDYLEIKSLRYGYCFAPIGNYGGKQPLRLDSGCETRGLALHELMHTLGFWHEHSRRDRDNYVTIVWENVPEDGKGEFKKVNEREWDSFTSRYDIRSIMQYGGYMFSKNGLPTILDKRTNSPIIANEKRLSKNDIFQINEKYKCFTDYCVDKFPRRCRETRGSCKNKYLSQFCKKTCKLC